MQGPENITREMNPSPANPSLLVLSGADIMDYDVVFFS
jgi:hypothetical protein